MRRSPAACTCFPADASTATITCTFTTYCAADLTTHKRRNNSALGAEWRGFWIAGIRESFEEAGVLLAYDRDGALLELHDDDLRQRFDDYRHALHRGELVLDEICVREGLMLAIDRMHFLNRWITPEGRPRRFDTRFFIAEAPAKQHGRHDEYETVDSLWISPARSADAQRSRRLRLDVGHAPPARDAGGLRNDARTARSDADGATVSDLSAGFVGGGVGQRRVSSAMNRFASMPH